MIDSEAKCSLPSMGTIDSNVTQLYIGPCFIYSIHIKWFKGKKGPQTNEVIHVALHDWGQRHNIDEVFTIITS